MQSKLSGFAIASKMRLMLQLSVCASVNELLGNLCMSIDHGKHEGAESVFCGDIQIGAVLQQNTHHLCPTVLGRQH